MKSHNQLLIIVLVLVAAVVGAHAFRWLTDPTAAERAEKSANLWENCNYRQP